MEFWPLAESSGRGKVTSRGVAQPGSAPALGAGGRRFKSSRPDHGIGEHPEGTRMRIAE